MHCPSYSTCICYKKAMFVFFQYTADSYLSYLRRCRILQSANGGRSPGGELLWPITTSPPLAVHNFFPVAHWNSSSFFHFTVSVLVPPPLVL